MTPETKMKALKICDVILTYLKRHSVTLHNSDWDINELLDLVLEILGDN